jgi:hypothetical protein
MQLAFLTFLPSIDLSGLLFPIEACRAAPRDRAQGCGPEYLWPNLLPLTVFGVVVFTLAVPRFREQLD